MKKVVKIEPSVGLNKPFKTKVAAYARVSTGSEEQLESLEAQIQHYEEYIQKNNEWEFVKVYFDEGITGTSVEERKGLLELLDDCKSGKIDLILTKSISRFSRNLTYSLEIIRELIDLDVFIYFEKEQINTGKMESEFILTILSSLAEDESKSISENVKWSFKKKVENGTYKFASSPFGYDIDEDGQLIVNKEESEIIYWIFKTYLNGKGCYKIARKLNAKGVMSPRNTKWTSKTIEGILVNERYIGNALLQKTYTTNDYKRKRNNGQEDMYLIENNHEPIISQDTFEKAQKLMKENALMKGNVGGNKYRNRYSFSGKIICGSCGESLKRRTHYSSDDSSYIAWACKTRLKDISKCSLKFLRDNDIKLAFLIMVNKLRFSRDLIIEHTLEKLRDENKKKLSKSNETKKEKKSEMIGKIEKLNQFYRNNLISNKIYYEEKQKLENLLMNVDLELESEELNKTKNIETINEFKKLNNIIKDLPEQKEFSSKLYDEIVDDIFVMERTRIQFRLKCGLKLEEELGG